MGYVTRWTDSKSKDIEAALSKFRKADAEDNSNNNNSYANFKKNVLLEKNMEFSVNKKDLVFNVLNYTFDKITKDSQENPTPVEDRTVQQQGTIVIYQEKSASSQVKYIINRNSDAQRILRLLLGYSGKNEIITNQLPLSSDMFIWLIKKIYTNDNSINMSSASTNFTVDSLIGFRGRTNDQINKVSADGDTLMNLISTLAFLLESNLMQQIKLNTSYGEHDNVELTISEGVIGTSYKNYSGIYEDEDAVSEVIEAKLLILIYLAIIPELVQAYNDSKDDNSWNANEHKRFLNLISEDVREKISVKVSSV